MNLTAHTFAEVMDAYIAESVMDPGTAAQYRNVARLVTRYGKRPTCADLFTRDGILAFRNWRMDEQIAPRTIRANMGVIRTLWNHAQSMGWVDTYPPKGRKINPPVPKRHPVAWWPREFIRIKASALRSRPVDRYWGPRQWLDLLDVLWYTAGRITGVLACDLGALDGNWLRLPADDDKELQEHPKELPEALANRLRQTARPGELLFPWQWGVNTLRGYFRQIVLGAGLECTPRDLFHKVRRTSITAFAVKHGVEAASRHAGHSSVKITIDSYIDPRMLPQTQPMPACQ